MLVLSEIVAAFQRDVIDHPDIVMDRMVAANTASVRGCIRAGEEAVHEALRELGPGAFESKVHAALETEVAPVLARRGTIRLVGEPR